MQAVPWFELTIVAPPFHERLISQIDRQRGVREESHRLDRVPRFVGADDRRAYLATPASVHQLTP